MTRIGLRLWPAGCVVMLSLALCSQQSTAASLDKEGDIKLGVRTYVNARVGTEDTHDGYIQFAKPKSAGEAALSATFPHSDAGHLRQNRWYIEAELNHDLDRLVREGWGPLSLLHDLPFKIKDLGYHLTFRGEADSLYDWGPNEYSTATQFQTAATVLDTTTAAPGIAAIDVPGLRKRLRHLASDRERLFQAYVEASPGNLFVRFGRQVLSWGETDGFRLLDNINPLDSSFGGFLISLDERRVPLDMLRTQYRIGDIGPLTEMFVEGYAAIDNKVAYYPGTPAGSPWALPSLGAPSNAAESFVLRPGRTVKDARGGGRLVFNALDATFSIAHYYTFFDTPAVQVFTSGKNGQSTVSVPFKEGLPCANPRDTSHNCGFPAHAIQTAPKVQVSGASTTFALPQFYSVVRSEFAYFKDEPAFTQGQLDPFIFNPQNNGGRRLRDSLNAVIGLDINQWIRALNPNQTFFFSTQFFFKHIRHGAGNTAFVRDATGAMVPNGDREVLPVRLDDLATVKTLGSRLEPFFIRQPTYQYLQTLFIGTSYRSGTINPGMTIFYDWGGAFLYQPTIAFSRDPFRFIIDYSIVDSHIYKGASGVSLLKDRDNVQFRFEYVI